MVKTKWNSNDGFGRHDKVMGNNEGVYVIIDYNIYTKKATVIYVGRSLNLCHRWKSHNIYNKAFEDGFFPGVKWKLCNNSAQLEQQLIKRFKPKYNKQFK